MKIYVVTQGEYSAYHIVGVTLDRQKPMDAELYCPIDGASMRGEKDE